MPARSDLRGNVGDDAIVIATNGPGVDREFITSFGLNQPGAQVALKVPMVPNTGNEAGSGAMSVEPPFSLPLAA